MIIFISGGARSGKSSYAEKCAFSLFKKRNSAHRLLYIATASVSDEEMKDRVQRHQSERGDEWETIEECVYLDEVTMHCEAGDVVLIDCLTVWLSEAKYRESLNDETLLSIIQNVLHQAKQKSFDVIFVSNDVNEGGLDDDLMVHEYVALLERVHRSIIEKADQVLQFSAGIPTFWKGKGE